MTNIGVPLTLDDPLTAAASLMATAALKKAAAAIHVSVVVSGTSISIQVPRHGAKEAARTAAVAAYAEVLGVPVRRRVGPPHVWIEADGYVGRHAVQVWTIAGEEPPQRPKVVYPSA